MFFCSFFSCTDRDGPVVLILPARFQCDQIGLLLERSCLSLLRGQRDPRLNADISDENTNTEGHCNISIEYLSSNESAGTVDPDSGAITYLTEEPFYIIAKVQYSDMTDNGEARFEKSHVMYFKTPVAKGAV